MKIVKQEAKPILESDFYKKIEICGRVCYKSEDRITEDSAKKFCQMLVDRGHLSVFEHWQTSLYFYDNAREFIENGYSLDGIVNLKDQGTDYITLHLTSSIQALRQLFRHRKLSISQESTRYCRYRHGITVIEPLFDVGTLNYDIWENSVLQAERAYMQLLEEGAKPEEAASILPMCTKSEAMVTATFEDWDYIIDVRTKSDVFPQTRQLAEMIKLEVEKAKENQLCVNQ